MKKLFLLVGLLSLPTFASVSANVSLPQTIFGEE